MPTETTIESGRRRGAGRRLVTELVVTGMTCSNCARHVTEALQTVAGVRSANVNLEAGQAVVSWETGTAPAPEAAIKAVEAEGFGARVAEAQTCEHGEQKMSGWQVNLWVGILGTLPLMLGDWFLGWSMERWYQWFSFVLASVVQTLAGARFYRGAWGQLRVGSSNMDTLVALGSTTAYAYSTWALFSGQPGHLYFMEAAAIITLISVGHWLESRVSVRASSALHKLLNLAPPLARRRGPDGAESEVPAAELEAGELVVLRPGDRVPTDGVATEGTSVVDESMLTGESVPVDKSAGSELYAGTTNLSGRLVMRVTATGDATALAHIIAAVQRAQTSRANIQRLGDRVSNVFVPLVVMVALAAALWWGLAPESAARVHAWLAQFLWPTPALAGPLATALITAAAVLIIACPCAMGLATPAAIMAGSNAAAQRGILIRDGVALEKAGSITTVLFDKTGTLTVGKPSIVGILEVQSPKSKVQSPGRTVLSLQSTVHSPQSSVLSPQSAPDGGAAAETAALRGNGEMLRLAAGLARHSAHPISQAVGSLCADGAEVSEWQEVHGAGVLGKIRNPKSEGRKRSEIRSPKSETSEPEPLTSHPASGIEFPTSAWAGHATRNTQHARLGSLRWLKETGVNLDSGNHFVTEWSSQGASIVGLALDDSLVGLFAVKDTVKPGAREVVRQLSRQGLKVGLVTGDNPLTAASIAEQAGIDSQHVFAEVRPEQKAELVKRLQQQGEQVAFVGDGINDAPALEQADLGVAVKRASDIAREAADIILLKSEIEAVPESLGLARATLRTIRQNLFWAFFYNAVGIPLAAMGFMSPVLCAAAMGLSDMVVLGNALRLRRWRL